MANLTDVNTNFFATASETYTNNLSASISAGEDIVPVNSANEYLDGDIVVLTVEPGTTNEATFTGVKASSPDRFTNCKWTEGNVGVGHASGSTIVDYDSATHFSMLSKGVQKVINQDGTLKPDPIRSALGIVAAEGSGWETFPYPITIGAGDTLGNNSFNLTVVNQDVSNTLSKGMRLRLPRTGTTPTQSASFNGTTQYASKSSPTGITFTDDFTVEGWIKLDSYPAIEGVILSRFSTSGFICGVNSVGQLFLYTGTGVGKKTQAVISVPLNKWVHIALTMNMSSTSGTILMDGVEVSSTFVTTTGASLTQAGDLQIGARTSDRLVAGKLSDVRLWNTIRTNGEIRDNMNQQLTGSETGLIGYWKLNGDFNDSTSNANHLTAQAGATATHISNPFNANAYAIIMSDPVFASNNTTMTVSTATGYNIPNETLASASYSTVKIPYGFPAEKEKWNLTTVVAADVQLTGSQTATYKDVGINLSVPIGSWKLIANFLGHVQIGTAGSAGVLFALSPTIDINTDGNLNGAMFASPVSNLYTPYNLFSYVDISVQTKYNLTFKPYASTTYNSVGFSGFGNSAQSITAECAYL